VALREVGRVVRRGRQPRYGTGLPH
jgi:hypothetical protein